MFERENIRCLTKYLSEKIYELKEKIDASYSPRFLHGDNLLILLLGELLFYLVVQFVAFT